MFCFQCEQTAQGKGCTAIGVCGKQPDVAALQDLLVHLLKGLSQVAHAAREKGIRDEQTNELITSALFSTLTTVDFDPDRLSGIIDQVIQRREDLKKKFYALGDHRSFLEPAILFPPDDLAGRIRMGEAFSPDNDPEMDRDIASLKQTVIYGLKGVAAYADHARVLGYQEDRIDDTLQDLLIGTLSLDKGLGEWVELTLKTGELNLWTMELLDKANTETYGHPVPTRVPLGPRKGKAILVSGHDLKDLADLLEQTEGKNISIYTHGEMLPCHGYPKLKEHEHFYGHYGTAWQNQHKEFAAFPGAILMTTNCLQKPRPEYKDNIFTTGQVAWPGVPHIEADENHAKDFTPVIERALALPGFVEDQEKGEVTTGFARNAVLSVADTVVDAVKSGAIRHFFLVAGCDGARPGRNYYTEFVEKTPEDTVVLTLACGKFRFFDKNLGEISGIPRLLDVGQCNDSYSAIQIALALSDAFGVDVNDLPLSMILSWYEQKAVAILLTLLYLGIKDIRLGPSLPAFLSPNVLNYLVENYGIRPIATPDQDLADILAA